MSDLTEAITRLDQLDESLYLGRICWYAITNTSHIEHNAFCQELLRHFNSAALPPVPRSSDVFKRACTAAQKKNVPTTESDKLMNILIREVGKDANNIWRHVVVETVDTSGHALDYSECVSIHYDRQAQSINVKPICDSAGTPHLASEDPAVLAVVQEVRDLYSHWFNMLTPYAVREHIRRLVRNMGATILRDGVYFVPQEHADKVEALEKIVEFVGGGSMFHSLPLVDDRKQRKMLRAAFEEDSVGQIDAMLAEIGNIFRNDRKISSATFADYKVAYDGLRGKIANYSDLLDEAMETTASRLEVMDRALFDLMGRVKS